METGGASRELAVGYRENTAAMRVTLKREGKAGAIGVRIGMPVLLRVFTRLDEEVGARDFTIDARGRVCGTRAG